MDKKKQLLLSIGLVLILVLMIVGISYAAFKFTGLGNKPNTITTGAITMEYEESTNTISMTGALPTTDATGKVRLTKGEYFDFTIKSSIKGNANINWEIAAEDITASSVRKMAGKNIKLYLTKLDSAGVETQVMAPKVYNASTSANTKTGRPSGVMSLATGTMSASETTNYRLRMYVDEDYNPQGDGGGLSFSVKINAYGKVKEAPSGSKIKAYMTQADYDSQTSPETDFHTYDYKEKITSIITKKDNVVPATAIESWDISEASDGSVMAYVEDDGTGNSTYKVTIGGKDGIIANESMISYFTDFYEMTSIDLSAFDTSEVTDMEEMFASCSSLTSLDVSKFDTSQVTDMSGMFLGCSSLTSLDISKFDTSKVTNMSNMFAVCSNLTSLDVRNFDTSQVTDMSSMFSNCSGLTSLDVSRFDTSQVTNMTSMFWNCKSLTSLDLSNFDTSNVTNMSEMFLGCSSLTSLNVSNFDTSKVTNMSNMFASCGSLTSLDLSNFDTSNVTNMSNMFASCGSLTSLDVSKFDTLKVTNMSRMFGACIKLTQITVSNKWVISSSTNITDMFLGCGTDHVTVV
ncbi:MAG: BspA family leucine-rich repeat surface protein [Bacilli bacterium]|jgi:surface protein|nr:BspA family leucine-rich repeat surface protein [Bacilli bacterium]